MELLGYSEAMKNSLKCFGPILICRVSHEKGKIKGQKVKEREKVMFERTCKQIAYKTHRKQEATFRGGHSHVFFCTHKPQTNKRISSRENKMESVHSRKINGKKKSNVDSQFISLDNYILHIKSNISKNKISDKNITYFDMQYMGKSLEN